MKLEKPTLFQSALLVILIIFCTLYYQQSKIGAYTFSGDNDNLMLDTRNGTVYYWEDEDDWEGGNAKWKIGVKIKN